MRQKSRKHKDNCVHAGLDFSPLIFSTAGSVHDETRKVVNFVADLRALRLGMAKATARRNLLDRISVAIHVGNAKCILNHGFYTGRATL